MTGATDEAATRRAVIDLELATVVAAAVLTNRPVADGADDLHPLTEPWATSLLNFRPWLREGKHPAVKKALSLLSGGTYGIKDHRLGRQTFSKACVVKHVDRLCARPDALSAWLMDNPDLMDGLVGDLLADVWHGDNESRRQLEGMLGALAAHDYPFAGYVAEVLASPVPQHPRTRPGRRALEALASDDELLHGSGVSDIEVLRVAQPERGDPATCWARRWSIPIR